MQTAPCAPLPRAIAAQILHNAGIALCGRPGEDAARKAARVTAFVHTVLGFGPRDGAEYALAITIAGHLDLIQDATIATFDAGDARPKIGLVALDRAVIALIREFHVLRKRPEADPAEETAVMDEAEAPVVQPARAVRRMLSRKQILAQRHHDAVRARHAAMLRTQTGGAQSGIESAAFGGSPPA